MWSSLTRSFIDPLLGYVEVKARGAERSKSLRNTALRSRIRSDAGFVRARDTAPHHTTAGVVALGTLRNKQSFFDAASLADGDLC